MHLYSFLSWVHEFSCIRLTLSFLTFFLLNSSAISRDLVTILGILSIIFLFFVMYQSALKPNIIRAGKLRKKTMK